MSSIAYKSSQIYTESGVMNGYMIVENQKITSLQQEMPLSVEIIDLADHHVLPGIFDTHNHGIYGHGFHADANKAVKYQNVLDYLKGMSRVGVTSTLPIVKDFYLDSVRAVMESGNQDCRILGLHCEGPFLNRSGENARYDAPERIDLEMAKELLVQYDGMMKVMSFAFELQGSDQLIAMLKEQGVQCSLAHTNAKHQLAMAAFDQGMDAVTHLGNAMTGIHHRDVGAFGTALLRDDVWTEVICDGHHLSLDMLQLIFRVKKYDKIMLVSDSSCYSMLPVGSYPSHFNEGSLIYKKEDGKLIDDHGRLCGSGLSVLHGMRNLVHHVGISLEEVWKFSSLNPAIRYGVSENKGSLKVGKDADFIVLNSALNLCATYLEGRCTYLAGSESLSVFLIAYNDSKRTMRFETNDSNRIYAKIG